MAKGDKFYYETLARSTEYSKKAASYLVQCLENYDPGKMDKMLNEMHQIEHSADGVKHEMSAALAKAFVTPIDREDLDMLSHQLDDVTDIIEEILQKFYIFNIRTIVPSAVTFAKKLVHSCELLCSLMADFENFKKSKKIHSLIIELNDVEEECDQLYLSSMRHLTESSTDALTTISWREIMGCFEACADACEHVGDCVESVVMKNT